MSRMCQRCYKIVEDPCRNEVETMDCRNLRRARKVQDCDPAEITLEEKHRWASILNRTWSELAQDAGQLEEADGKRFTKKDAIELTTDAGRMIEIGGMFENEHEVFCNSYRTRPSFRKWVSSVLDF